MLNSLLDDQPKLAQLKRLIIERTQGNPFFMEEIVQALLDDGTLVRNGKLKLTRSLAELKVPPTVQATLAARIDRLPMAEKQLLQTMAIIGREIALELVKQVTGNTEDLLLAMLSDLQMSEFIYEQPSLEGAEYIFKHALTQEVAYNSLLAERRHSIHEQTARAIEALYSGQLDDHYNELARHYLRGNDAARAVHYAQLAAEQAVSRGAYPEAIGLIKTALELLNRLPEEAQRLRAELALRTTESVVAVVLHGGASDQREHAVRRMCELGEGLGQPDHVLGGLIALASIHMSRGEPLLGRGLTKRYLTLLGSTNEAPVLAEAHCTAGLLAHCCGNFREALSHFHEAEHYASGNVSPFFGGVLFKTTIASMGRYRSNYSVGLIKLSSRLNKGSETRANPGICLVLVSR